MSKREGEGGGEPAAKKTKTEFEAVFPKLVAEIVADIKAKETIPEASVAYIERMCNYTVPGGKMNRGLTVLDALRVLRRAESKDETLELSEKDTHDASVLGWCVEWLQAFFLVADDLMDESVTRRGQPCWYRQPDVGTVAVNDSLLLEALMYEIIAKHFGDREGEYVRIVDLFRKTTFRTELGQLLDLTSEKKAKESGNGLDFSTFTEETHRGIVVYKTAFYTFFLPVACALILAGEKRSHVFSEAEEICKVMGEYFQVQDDYLDAYAPPEILGKVGTDIQDFKCSWLAVKCLQLADAEQRKVFEDNYGRKEDANVDAVKALYRQLKLEEVFQKYEEDSYTRINKLIDEVKDVDQRIYRDLLAKVYKRKK